MMNKVVWTIGHSTRTFEEFSDLLSLHQIGLLVDVRTYPGSRRYPHFNKEHLEATVNLQTGDVAIIPAGVSHRKVDEADGFTCLGAYPEGQDWDMNYGKEEERERALENIRKTPMPENDPLYGSDGPLNKNWLSAKDQNPSVL